MRNTNALRHLHHHRPLPALIGIGLRSPLDPRHELRLGQRHRQPMPSRSQARTRPRTPRSRYFPDEADYGPTATSSLGLTRQFLLNNLTTQPIALTLSLPRQFVLVDPPCTTLEPGSGCSFSVSFLPLTNGDITGTLFAQGPAGTGRHAINSLGYVKGFGRGQGTLTITGDLSPGRLIQFGQVPSGQTSIRSLTLTNSGTTPLTVRRITSEWPFLSSTTCGATISPAGSCAVTLIYSPLNQVAAGSSPAPFNTDTGTVVIESDAVSSPDFIDLTGTVTPAVVAVPSSTAPLYSYNVSQGSLSFISTRGGEVSAPQTITLSNTGSTTLHVRNLVSTPDFSVTGSCPTLIAGTSCPLTIAFTPQASSAQSTVPVVGALEILSDSSTSLDFVSLLGTATPSTLALSPASLDFGSVLVGTPAILPIRITNRSSISAIFKSITVTGDYTLAGDCPSTGAQLAPSASCTLQVSFKPSQTGARMGSVSIATSITTLPLVANLTGTGTQSHLEASPSSVSFGDVLLGASKSLTLTLANSGTETCKRNRSRGQRGLHDHEAVFLSSDGFRSQLHRHSHLYPEGSRKPPRRSSRHQLRSRVTYHHSSRRKWHSDTFFYPVGGWRYRLNCEGEERTTRQLPSGAHTAERF